MLTATLTQFRLGEDGIIRFQPHPTNPLPGEPIARLLKGDKILEPRTEVLEAAGHDKDAVTNLLNEWLKAYIRQALEPLTALEQTEGLAEPVKGICEKLYSALGIIPREQVQGFTAKLDPEMRQVLRGKQVRLGPVLVFLPALNKPAGVKLRGLLWALWNDKPLPPPLPHDGVVSVRVDENADRDYYRAISYPVYGPRAIRIDMLDRVINSIYDNAKDGKFQAQHKMAEWLGCPIDDLYGVLVAMGHNRLDDVKKEDVKTEEPPVEAAEAAAVDVGAPVDTPAEAPVAEAAVASEASAEAPVVETPAAKAPETKVVKPDLAFFTLRKGRPSQGRERTPRPERFKDGNKNSSNNRPKSDGKPHHKRDGKKRDDKNKNKDRDYNQERGKHNRDKHRPTESARVVSSASVSLNPEDSPFAILGQLKKAAKDGS
jgi:ATP-dependent RNA helicase SUPV3L1/SUV3